MADIPQIDPQACKFSREHEWVFVSEPGVGWMGVSDFAAHELGDIVFLQLPAAGDSVKQFAKLGEIESVKAASDLFSPISGQVLQTNEELSLHPELVNESPFQDAWMLQIRLSDPSELDALLDYASYQAFLADMMEESM